MTRNLRGKDVQAYHGGQWNHVYVNYRRGGHTMFHYKTFIVSLMCINFVYVVENVLSFEIYQNYFKEQNVWLAILYIPNEDSC